VSHTLLGQINVLILQPLVGSMTWAPFYVTCIQEHLYINDKWLGTLFFLFFLAQNEQVYSIENGTYK